MPDETDSGEEYSVPGCRLEEKIGIGGFGVVFRGFDEIFQDRQVAIKIIHPHPFTDLAKAEARFRRETQAQLDLNHPGIARYRRSGFTDGDPRRQFIVTDYVEGEELGKAATGLSIEQKVACIVDVLNALVYAHEKQILHRDIKPPNIMYRKSDGKAIIVDFGLAFVWDELSEEDLTTHYVGSLGYIPPEVQANPQARSPKHDIFSVGVTLYELLAGNRPNVQDYRPLREIDSALSGLDTIIERALAPESKRFESAKFFSSDLSDWLARHEKKKSINASPLYEKFRSNLQKQDAERKEREDKRLEEKERTKEIWNELNQAVFIAAEEAFEQVNNILRDQGRACSLEKAGGTIEHLGDKPTPVLTLTVTYAHGVSAVSYGFSTMDISNLLGVSGKSGALFGWLNSDLRRKDPHSPRRPAGFDIKKIIQPAWVIYSDYSSRSPRLLLRGAIAGLLGSGLKEGELPLFAHPSDTAVAAFARSNPSHLKTPQAVLEYIIRVLAAEFGVRLD